MFYCFYKYILFIRLKIFWEGEGMLSNQINHNEDVEWIELIKEAKEMGITKEEVLTFLAEVKENEVKTIENHSTK